jgi:hypothetical protein
VFIINSITFYKIIICGINLKKTNNNIYKRDKEGTK